MYRVGQDPYSSASHSGLYTSDFSKHNDGRTNESTTATGGSRGTTGSNSTTPQVTGQAISSDFQDRTAELEREGSSSESDSDGDDDKFDAATHRNTMRNSFAKPPDAIDPSGSKRIKHQTRSTRRSTHSSQRKRMSVLLTGGVSTMHDAESGIERGISDLDNMSVVCALYLTIFASFSASVNREELELINNDDQGKYLTDKWVDLFWLENFYGVALSVFSMCFCFLLRTSLYLNANTPQSGLKEQLTRWDSMFIYDVFTLRFVVLAQAVLVARVSGYLYCIKNPNDDLNDYGHGFTTICGFLLGVYVLTFIVRHGKVVGITGIDIYDTILDSCEGMFWRFFTWREPPPTARRDSFRGSFRGKR